MGINTSFTFRITIIMYIYHALINAMSNKMVDSSKNVTFSLLVYGIYVKTSILLPSQQPT